MHPAVEYLSTDKEKHLDFSVHVHYEPPARNERLPVDGRPDMSSYSYTYEASYSYMFESSMPYMHDDDGDKTKVRKEGLLRWVSTAEPFILVCA